MKHLARRAEAALALADTVKGVLAPELGCHITGAEYRQPELEVYVDSAAFCMRVQLELMRLKAPLARGVGAPVETISVRVQPPR